MEATMTQDWKDKYFDEKFKNLNENIQGVRREVKANTTITREAVQRVSAVEDKVRVLEGTPKSSKDLVKNIGIALGTAGAIIYAAVLAFRSFTS